MNTLSIVIPLYNENGRLKKTVAALNKGFNFDGLKLEEVIFIDDGSTDGSVEYLHTSRKELEKNLNAQVRIVSYSPNKGRGYAVRYGTMIAKSDYVLYTDADFSIPLGNLRTFIPYMDKGYDLIFGSKKKLGASELIPRSFARRIVGYGHSIIASLVLGVFAWDYQGGFKIFSRKLIQEVFPKLKVDRWGFDMEIIFLAKKLGYTTQELPVLWGHIENDSKVVLIRDIYRSLKELAIIRYQWFNGRYDNRRPFRFALKMLK